MSTPALNPEEFGLAPEKAKTIENSFTPALVERDGLTKVYEQLLTKEMSPETCDLAKELDKKLRGVEKAITSTHQKEKAYYLAGGRFVDAAKNKYLEPILQMREKLKEISTFYEEQEKQKAAAIKLERETQLKALEVEGYQDLDLGTMRQDVWESYLQISQNKFDKIVEERNKAAAAEAEKKRKQDLHNTRKEAVLHLWNFTSDFERTLHLGEQSESDYNNFVERLNNAKKAADEKAAELEAQNKILRDKAAAAAKIEEEKRALRQARANELRPYLTYIVDYEAMLGLVEEEYKKLLASIKVTAEKAEKEKQEKEALLKKRTLELTPYLAVIPNLEEVIQEKDEKKYSASVVAITKKFAIFDAEQKKLKEEQEKALRGDAEEMKLLIAEIKALKINYSFKAKPYVEVQKSVNILLDKIVTYIEEKKL